MVRRRLVVALVILAAPIGAACGETADAPRITDRLFSAAAEGVCRKVIPALRPDLKQKDAGPDAEVAAAIEERATKLTALTQDLRGLEVARADAAAVEAWLDDWDSYLAVGRRYARAVRGGDPAVHTSVAAQGVPVQKRISAFARANQMPGCALDGQPLPERESPL